MEKHKPQVPLVDQFFFTIDVKGQCDEEAEIMIVEEICHDITCSQCHADMADTDNAAEVVDDDTNAGT